MRRAIAGWAFLVGVAAAGSPRDVLAGDDATAPPAAKPPEIRREIRVRIACDEEWRAQKGWEKTARERLAAASAVYEKEFGIRWKAVDVVEWTSDDAAPSLDVLIHQAEREVPHADVDVLLTFSGQMRGTGADRDYAAAGLGRYYGPSAIVRQVERDGGPSWYVSSLVHELGHVLGAWHSEDPGSVMAGTGRHVGPPKFDAQSRAAIEVGRDVDFGKGVDSLTPDARAKIAAAYRSGHEAHWPVPYVDAAVTRADERYRRDRDLPALREAYRRALADQEACSGPDDPALCPCLRWLAWACEYSSTATSYSEAQSLLRRSLAILDKTRVVENPPLATAFMLADFAWREGRRAEAEATYRNVYETRLSRLGASDPNTVEAAAMLDRLGIKSPSPADAAPTPWTDIAWRAAPPLPEVFDVRYGSPKPGTIHVRRIVGEPPSNRAARPNEFEETYGLALPTAGTLAVAFRESGGGTDPSDRRAVLHVAAGAVDEREPRLRVVCLQSPDDVAADDYTLLVTIDAPGEGSSAVMFGARGTRDAGARLIRGAAMGATEFARLPMETALLREWLWVAKPWRRDPITFFDKDSVVVDGVRVTPDGAGAKRTWRLELSFVPDAPK